MDFSEYQKIARTTAVYPVSKTGELNTYPYLGLAGETGEVCEKAKKLIRDKNGVVTQEFKDAVKKELGDVLWYLSNTASDLDLTLEEIAICNMEKLLSRKERGVLGGSGDNR